MFTARRLTQRASRWPRSEQRREGVERGMEGEGGRERKREGGGTCKEGEGRGKEREGEKGEQVI